MNGGKEASFFELVIENVVYMVGKRKDKTLGNRLVLGIFFGFMLAWGAYQFIEPLLLPFDVKITKECDQTADRCVYIRTERSHGINYFTVTTIHFDAKGAAHPSYSQPRVQCDAEAHFKLDWQPDKLRITSTDNSGECEIILRGYAPFEVETINR